MGNLVALILFASLIDNFILIRFFGICPFLRFSRRMDVALGLGLAVGFIITSASLVTWLIFYLLLVPLQMEFMRTVAFILAIVFLVPLTEKLMKKVSPSLSQNLDVFTPLITTNCAVVAAVLLNILQEFTLLQSVAYGFGAAAGFTLILMVMAGIRERLELVNLPRPFQGVPITLVAAGILSIAFLGFRGMISL